MKKALALCLALVLVLGIGAACLVKDQYDRRDDVTFEENVRLGDPSMMEGVQVEVTAEWDNRLFWRTRYTMGEEPTVETEYEFAEQKTYPESEFVPSGVMMESYIEPYVHYEDFNDPNVELFGIEQAYYDLAQRTPADGYGEETVLLSDYFDYYPLSIGIEIDHYSQVFVNTADRKYFTDQQWELYELFHDYFKIPVLEGQMYGIHLSKNEAGYVNTLGGGSGDGDAYHMFAQSVVTEDACIFTFNTDTQMGDVIDTSLLPEGYGVYRMPYTFDGENMDSFRAEKIEMVYPLQEGIFIQQISLIDGGRKVELITCEEDGTKIVCYLFDAESMELLQRFSFDKAYLYYVYHDDANGLTLLLFDDTLVLLQKNIDGLYDIVLDVPSGGDGLFYEIFSNNLSFTFDGERLLICTVLQKETSYMNYESAGFILAAYDKDGMYYLAEYDSSLSTGHNGTMYNYDCHVLDGNGFDVSW